MSVIDSFFPEIKLYYEKTSGVCKQFNVLFWTIFHVQAYQQRELSFITVYLKYKHSVNTKISTTWSLLYYNFINNMNLALLQLYQRCKHGVITSLSTWIQCYYKLINNIYTTPLRAYQQCKHSIINGRSTTQTHLHYKLINNVTSLSTMLIKRHCKFINMNIAS